MFTIEISLSCAPQSLREHRNQRAKRISVSPETKKDCKYSRPTVDGGQEAGTAAFRHAAEARNSR
ncbi:hypothetical protein ACFFTN_08090 [Aminobacter aganoensis]|uniref:Uncharacterized protein n=1 Tax=Aminobacter aganoensis TaxID=83264 RepID=A0A7X0F9K3_9HYPH|nr:MULTISPECIES: hypothetical protein [Aminobacter]MBB6355657.1 hypothetical protein [Aminobacter aganoensis]